jgi:hypothetical protein
MRSLRTLVLEDAKGEEKEECGEGGVRRRRSEEKEE